VFVAANGMICPRCRSGDVSLSEPRLEGQSMFEDGECTACGCEFYTVLRLVGYGLQGDSFVDGQENVFSIAEDFPEIQTGDEPVVGITPTGPPLADSKPASESEPEVRCFMESEVYGHETFKPLPVSEALEQLRQLVTKTLATVSQDAVTRRIGIEVQGEDDNEDELEDQDEKE